MVIFLRGAWGLNEGPLFLFFRPPPPPFSFTFINVYNCTWMWMFSIHVANCRLFSSHPSLSPSLLFSSVCQSEHLPLHKLPISHWRCLISRLRHSLAPWASARHPGFLLDLLWGCLAGIPKPTHCKAKHPTFVLSLPLHLVVQLPFP